MSDPESAAGKMQGPSKERSAMHVLMRVRVIAGRADWIGLDWIELNWIDKSIAVIVTWSAFPRTTPAGAAGKSPSAVRLRKKSTLSAGSLVQWSNR